MKAGLCILCFAFYVLLLPAYAETAPKRHKVTIGMYNTYSMKDGNLGRSEPDLKEVWAGVPNAEYEACNMTMHYWPRPGDLPDVKPGENPYTAWWKAYMEEAYNLTNQNGEVRFRVIVGALYSYYEAYKGETFNEFIADLCKWEKGSKYEGTLAGWYLAEEPMGSGHNYDPEICNEMAETIKAIEKSLGVRQHSMYIDVTITGMYYNSSALAAFTRMADVVMISANTFLWTTSSQQPVYETSWKRIHQSLKEARNIIYNDRDRHKMPYPEFQVVLEARDAIGHGQPTNWEMRQQIHTALSQSQAYNDPPADGVWFFWWTEIGRNKKDDTDDWNYGRRLAEAIQVQVPLSTFAESPSVKKASDPPKTRFRFSEFGSFNPTNSCIPYDLAEPGYVRVEVLDENLSQVKNFDMKYQVPGELRRFGGPYWQRSGAHNGFYIFRLYLNSKLEDEVKTKVQWSVMLNSTSHQPGIWSTSNVITVQWQPQSEDIKGLSGYSILWDTYQSSYPDTQIDLTAQVTTLSSNPLPDGDSNYFHILSVDGMGNSIVVDHLGPFYIDTRGPGNARDLASDSHKIGEWSKSNRVIVHWNPAEDAASGTKGYSVLWDNAPGALPDKEMDISSDVTVLASEPLGDGAYYFHIRSVDNAGNWAYTAAHAGPFLIDRSPPEGVNNLVSDSHVPGQWSNKSTVTVSWKAAEDMVSGLAGYSAIWDNSPNTIPDKSIVVDKKTSAVSPPLDSSKERVYFFHITSADKAGNWSNDVQHLGPFMIDTEPPPKVKDLISTSHKPDKWSPQTQVDIIWTPVQDSISGTAGYEWSVSRDEHAAGEWKPILQPPLYIPQLENGLWYIYVRAVDKAGNLSDLEHVTVKIDSEPPDSPVIWSSSHPAPAYAGISAWYTSPEVTLEWAAEDKISGINGYSWSWDTKAGTIPDELKDVLEGETGKFLASQGVWYFHIRATDEAGNWGDTSHFRVQIDPSAPPAPHIASDTHGNSEWVARADARLSWEIPAPGPSGIAGYSYLLDQNPLSTPEEFLSNNISRIDYSDLPDGLWYFHCRAKSGSGLWGPAAHYGIWVDTVPPQIEITYPQDGKWYTEAITEYTWNLDDLTSGADWSTFEYSYNGGTWTRFVCDAIKQRGGVLAQPGVVYWGDFDEIPHCMEAEGDTLQIRVRDRAGNLGVSAPIIIRVDRSISPPAIVSSTHPDQDRWYISGDPDFAWDLADRVSGADGYSWAIDHSENTVPPQIKMIEGGITFKTDIAGLSDGVWYFHLRGRDKAGNWSETAHYRIKIDSTAPTALVKISGPAVINRDPPLARSGPVKVLLKTSEPVFNPVLEYKPASATSPVPIKLTAAGLTEWGGFFDVTIRTGDGKAVFLFSARDEAGNVGREIASGGSFMVDTLVYADADENLEVLCVAEPGTMISLPPGAITQDMRIEILKSVSPSVTAMYDIIPYDSRMRHIRDLIFKTPVEITFSIQNQPGDGIIGVYYWDRVKWHKIQDSGMTVKVDYTGRFALMKSEPMTADIMYGWAAPNPFTPNGSGDQTDRVIFHVATKQNQGSFEVDIYDITGRLIRHLDGGRRTWDGTDEDGRIVEGGLYIYQIQSGKQILSGTVVVIK